MSQAVEVDPDQLRRAAGMLAQIGDTLDSAATTLNKALSSAGKPWSDDEYGKEFFEGSEKSPGYDTGSSEALTDFAGLVSAIEQYSSTMRDAADSLQRTDETSYRFTAA